MDNRSTCGQPVNIDDYAGLHAFGDDEYRYIRLKADSSISIFYTPVHIDASTIGDDSGLPGWQSATAEIDAVGSMACDVKPIAEAGPLILGQTRETIAFDASGSRGDISVYAWDLDGDAAIDLTGATPDHVFNAGFDSDVTLFVVDSQGCVDTDTVRVTIGLNYPKPDLTVLSVERQSVQQRRCPASDQRT